MNDRAVIVERYPNEPTPPDSTVGRIESIVSAVTWSSILGGAFVAAALSLILLALGSGLGLSSFSVWDSRVDNRLLTETFGIVAAIWLIVTHALPSALGGYVAGRLRTKWVNVHSDEVFFRDTAHGLIVWAVCVVATAAFLTSTATLLASAGAQATATMANAAATAGASRAGAPVPGNPMIGSPTSAIADRNAYLADSLLQPTNAGVQSANAPAPPATASVAPVDDAAARAEVARTLASGLRNGDLSSADRARLVNVVVRQTGATPADAERRVDMLLAQTKAADNDARQAAEVARKAASYFSLWVFVALLTGAFCASFAATLGGRRRDRIAY